MERVSSGIDNLDHLIMGGFPKNSVITVAGKPGTGKTILSLQFLYKGALKNESGLFLTLEQETEDIIEQASVLNWNVSDLINKKKFFIKRIEPWSAKSQSLFQDLASLIKKHRIKRLVVDSATTLSIFASSISSLTSRSLSPSTVKERMWKILHDIKQLNCTTILTAEAPKKEDSEWYTRDTITEFLCDVLILLDKSILGELETKTLSIVKARKTDYQGGIYSFEIKPKKGIEVKLSSE